MVQNVNLVVVKTKKRSSDFLGRMLQALDDVTANNVQGKTVIS